MSKVENLAYQRIVVKLGTSLLTGGTEQLNQDIISSLVAQVARLHEQGGEVILVSSGAIAAGKDRLGIQKRIRGVPFKQVMASVGQSRLMHLYDRLFAQHNIAVAQALLTKTDLADRAGYLNARNTLLTLLELRVLCVVNENDVVAIDEIAEAKFGDNDNLSATVANLVDADLLMILSDIDGLYTADPHCDPNACLIPEVEKIDAEIEQMVAGSSGGLGTGGMITKIEAAKLATASGVTLIVANGREPDIIMRLAGGEKVGTHFLPATSKLESRRRWMLCGLSVRGRLVVDPGAAQALKKKRGSLLAAGISEVESEFERGDIVNIYDQDGIHVGCGIANYSSVDIRAIKGVHSAEITKLLGYDYGSEVVHRNNLAVL